MSFTSILALANAAVNIPLSATAIVGNALVLVSISRTPSLISPSNVLLLGLACTDLCVGLVVQPLYMAVKFIQFTDPKRNIETPFLVQTYIAAYLCVVSFLNVTSLSVDRFLALHLHLRYKELVTVKRTATLLGILWIVTAAAMYVKAYLGITISRIIAASIWCLVNIVNVILYCKIYRILRRHRLQINSELQLQSNTTSQAVNITRLKRSFVNAFYVYLIFMACYLPFVVMIAFASKLHSSVFEVSWTFAYANSSFNPLMFSWRVQGIRAAMKRTVEKVTEWLLCRS